MRFTLVPSDDEPRQIPVRGTRVRIGRSKDNDVVVRDPMLSRHHAELVFGEQGWTVRDLGSRNGTFLNGEKVEEAAPLTDGDAVRMGGARLLVGASAESSGAALAISGESPTIRTVHAISVTPSPEMSQSRLLVEAAREVASSRPSKDILEALLTLALRATGADRGVVATLDETGHLIPMAAVSYSGPGPAMISESLLSRVLGQHKALIVEDVGGDAQLANANTLANAGVRSVLCAPLETDGRTHGIFYLDSVGKLATFDPGHLDVVTTLAGMAGVTLENESAHALADAKRFLDAQLATAGEIQSRLLAPSAVETPRGFSTACRLVPCHTVGGDFYQFFSWGNSLGAVVADVSGKGLGAALLMANLHARWEGVRCSERPPGAWLSRVNLELLECLPDNRFVTLAFGLADPAHETLFFASAGHTSGLLIQRDGQTRLDATGPPLGLFGDARFATAEYPFRAGDRLVLCSDGIADQLNPDGEKYGTGRLEEVARSAAASPPEEMLAAILDHLEAYAGDAGQEDDMTVAILGREPLD